MRLTGKFKTVADVYNPDAEILRDPLAFRALGLVPQTNPWGDRLPPTPVRGIHFFR